MNCQFTNERLASTHNSRRAADTLLRLSRGFPVVAITGSWPPLFDRDIAPADWYPAYVATYLERDLHQLIHVRDLSTFQRFLRLCAGRAGQMLNLSALAIECGITHNTAKAWISVLEVRRYWCTAATRSSAARGLPCCRGPGSRLSPPWPEALAHRLSL